MGTHQSNTHAIYVTQDKNISITFLQLPNNFGHILWKIIWHNVTLWQPRWSDPCNICHTSSIYIYHSIESFRRCICWNICVIYGSDIPYIDICFIYIYIFYDTIACWWIIAIMVQWKIYVMNISTFFALMHIIFTDFDIKIFMSTK